MGFDVSGSFPLSVGSGFGKNVIILGVDMSSPMHFDNEKKYILILGKSPTQGLDNTTFSAEEKYFKNFTKQQQKFMLMLYVYACICKFMYMLAL